MQSASRPKTNQVQMVQVNPVCTTETHQQQKIEKIAIAYFVS